MSEAAVRRAGGAEQVDDLAVHRAHTARVDAQRVECREYICFGDGRPRVGAVGDRQPLVNPAVAQAASCRLPVLSECAAGY